MEIIGARVMKLSQHPSQSITFNTDTAQVSFLDDRGDNLCIRGGY